MGSKKSLRFRCHKGLPPSCPCGESLGECHELGINFVYPTWMAKEIEAQQGPPRVMVNMSTVTTMLLVQKETESHMRVPLPGQPGKTCEVRVPSFWMSPSDRKLGARLVTSRISRLGFDSSRSDFAEKPVVTVQSPLRRVTGRPPWHCIRWGGPHGLTAAAEVACHKCLYGIHIEGSRIEVTLPTVAMLAL